MVLDIFDVIFEILDIALIDKDDLTVLYVAIYGHFFVALHKVDKVTRVVFVEIHDEFVHPYGFELAETSQTFFMNKVVLKRAFAQLETVV